MDWMSLRLRGWIFSLLLLAGVPALVAQAGGPSAERYPRVLTPAEAGATMPKTVFFEGLAAEIQARNSGGIAFAKGRYLLAALVDTAGYSTSVQERYQAYLITERAVLIDGHKLVPGSYGVGFLAGDRFLVMDLGGNELFTAHAEHAPELKRPTPLQIAEAPVGVGGYRLLAGRTFVSFKIDPDGKP